MARLVVATGNRGKLAEIEAVLAGLGIELVAQSELGIPEADETGATFVENALLKARQACARSGLPALADDSGLCVDALAGAPGLISAHYGGVHGDAQRNIARLLRELQDVPTGARTAHFLSTIVVLRHAGDPAPVIVEGRWDGEILTAPSGTGGFGYDPVFYDPLLGASAAELPPERKNRVSHRGRALFALRERLQRDTLGS